MFVRIRDFVFNTNNLRSFKYDSHEERIVLSLDDGTERINNCNYEEFNKIVNAFIEETKKIGGKK
jgi:hypothetical protein